ncbi:aa3-type cytochrome c oxidase subunit IV [Lacibacterium aquatile]|uniref:Aa3-type cytochrome c oxidase subunit IV n=1 Tax=Lacibacterium aquatile TaxID=1168082 RepID=A0ABW5DJS3_9PROT
MYDQEMEIRHQKMFNNVMKASTVVGALSIVIIGLMALTLI